MAILASLPTLDDGGLAVRQVRGDPNREIRIPGTSPDSHRRPIYAPVGPAMEAWHPPTKRRSRRRPARGAAATTRRTGRGGSAVATDPSWGSRPPSARGRWNQWGRVDPELRCRRPIASSSRRGGQRSRGGFRRSSDHHRRHISLHSSARRHHRHRPSGSSRPCRHHHHNNSNRPAGRPGASLREEAIPSLPGRMGGAELHLSG
jgi:hypothetical protein